MIPQVLKPNASTTEFQSWQEQHTTEHRRLNGVTAGFPLTQQTIGQISYPQTQAEKTAGVMPTNFVYQPGDWRRYGADPTGAADSSTAIHNAGLANSVAFAYPGTYKVASNITHTAPVVMYAGAVVTPSASVTVTFAGTIQAGPYQIFNIAASGSFIQLPQELSTVPAEWWGAQAYPSSAVNCDVAINAAITSLASTVAGAYGGTVTLERGDFFITNTIVMSDNIAIEGKGRYYTLIKNGAATNGWAVGATYPEMFRIYSASGSPMNCPIRNMRIDGNADTSLTSIVYGPSWQEQSGFDGVFVSNFYTYGFFSDDAGSGARGGAAQLTFKQTQFSAASTSAGSCIRIVYDATVGWLCINLIEVQCNGSSAFQSGLSGVNVGGTGSTNGRVIVNAVDYHAEQLTQAVILDRQACLIGNSVKVDGSSTVTDVLYMQSTWTGFVRLLQCRKGGATNYIADQSRSITGWSAVETYDGSLIWPPSPTNALAAADVTGGATPVFGYNQGFASVTHTATGEQTLTLTTTMDGSSTYDVIATSLDPVNAPIIGVSKSSGTVFIVYTYSPTGVAANAGEFSVKVYRRAT